MKKSLLRSFRKTVKTLSATVVVDNVSKVLGVGGWRVPFEWLLDRDVLSLDSNSQRTCAICPDLAEALVLEDWTAETAGTDLVLNLSWSSGGDVCPAEVPTPRNSIPCTLPIRSTVVIKNDELQGEQPPPTSRGGVDVGCSSSSGSGVRRTGISCPASRPAWLPKTFEKPRVHRLDPPVESILDEFLEDPKRHKEALVLQLERLGFVVVRDSRLSAARGSTSAELVANRSAVAERIITESFAVLRNCHYGAMSTWSDSDSWKEIDAGDPRELTTRSMDSSPAHLDGAYMSSLLDLHTDCTYFIDCPRLQAFGCALTTSRTVGGETTLCDGFAVAQALLRDDPDAFDTLTKVPVGGCYRKEGNWYEAYRPVIRLSPCGNEVEQISFNNSDRIALGLNSSLQDMKQFYRAYYKFHALAHEFSIRFMLRPGLLLFFDNHRVLHGRQQFAGPRVMCGAYIGSDEYLSALRMATHAKKS